MLVPLLARSGLAGMLVLGPAPRRRRPVTDAEARLVSVVAARAAIAVENYAYQKELIASERLAALGTMAGMLAHDFRGPMTLIRGWAETLVEGDVPPSEVVVRARAIVDAVDRLERMTGETLDFVRGAERLVLRRFPLGMLLAELAAGIEQELPGLTVERDFDLRGGRRGTFDVDKIRRAVTNIAANARDAMGGRGTPPALGAGRDAPRCRRSGRAPRARARRRGSGRPARDPRAGLRALRDPRQEARAPASASRWPGDSSRTTAAASPCSLPRPPRARRALPPRPAPRATGRRPALESAHALPPRRGRRRAPPLRLPEARPGEGAQR